MLANREATHIEYAVDRPMVRGCHRERKYLPWNVVDEHQKKRFNTELKRRRENKAERRNRKTIPVVFYDASIPVVEIVCDLSFVTHGLRFVAERRQRIDNFRVAIGAADT